MSGACPASMRDAIARRCEAVRDGSLEPYGELLRANAMDVVRSMYPLFCARRGERALRADVEAFVRHGAAREARFLHLATEFLRFAAGKLPDPVARALLEYEWTQFAVETDEADVRAAPGAGMALNPTVRVVALPFELEDDVAALSVRAGRPPFVHALYRTPAHDVVTRALAGLDIHMLRRLTQGDACGDSAEAAAWLAEAIQSGLVVVPQPR